MTVYRHINPDWDTDLGFELWLRRDELLHPLISGNKYFKLEGWLEKYYREGYKGLVTVGGPYSNHVLATAWICAQRGIPCRLLLRGEAVQNPLLDIASACGAVLEFVPRELFRDAAYMNGRIQPGELFIPEGGSGKEGTLAYSYEASQLEGFDQVWMAVGTGTTMAAWANGASKAPISYEVHGVVVFKADSGWEEPVRALDATDFKLHYGFHFGGYARESEVLDVFMRDFYQKTGILLDHIYTAKAIWPLFNDPGVKAIIKGKKILFLHTGGLFGSYASSSGLFSNA